MEKIVPKYAIIPLSIMLIVNFFTYNITPIWTDKMMHYSLDTDLDKCLPFVPSFVIVYILAYAQWVTGYLAVANTNKNYCEQVMLGEILSKLTVCIIFLVLPTTMDRPDVVGKDIFSKLVSLIYSVDKPINLFPSIHCLESWICYRSSKCYFGRKYRLVMGIMTMLVFLSTVLIKQHLIVDMLGAVIVAEIGAIVANKLLKRKQLWLKG